MCHTSQDMVLEQPATTLSSGDDCVIRWSDGCHYEAEVLRSVSDYVTVKRIEKELTKELDAGKENEGTNEPPAKRARQSKGQGYTSDSAPLHCSLQLHWSLPPLYQQLQCSSPLY